MSTQSPTSSIKFHVLCKEKSTVIGQANARFGHQNKRPDAVPRLARLTLRHRCQRKTKQRLITYQPANHERKKKRNDSTAQGLVA